MKNLKTTFSFLLFTLFPLTSFAEEKVSGFHLGAELINYINYAVLLIAIISIKQFFWPKNNKTPFHIFSIISIIIFYIISLTFLVDNRQNFEGYENQSPLGCIFKFFFSMEWSSFEQWIILFGFIINIIYITKYRNSYYSQG